MSGSRKGSSKESFLETDSARQSLLNSGVISVLADPGLGDPDKTPLAVAMRHAKTLPFIRPGDQMVITQKIGNFRTIAIIAAN